MGLGVAAHISIDVIVVSGSGLDKVFGRVLVWLVIGLTTRTPSRCLHAARSTFLHFDGVGKLVITRARAVNLLWLQMGLGTKSRVETSAVWLDASSRHTLVIETRTKLIAGAGWRKFDWVLSWAYGILRLLCCFCDAFLLILHPLIVRPKLVGLDSKLLQKQNCHKKLERISTYR